MTATYPRPGLSLKELDSENTESRRLLRRPILCHAVVHAFDEVLGGVEITQGPLFDQQKRKVFAGESGDVAEFVLRCVVRSGPICSPLY